MKQKMTRKIVLYFTDDLFNNIQDFASKYNLTDSQAIKFLTGVGLDKLDWKKEK